MIEHAAAQVAALADVEQRAALAAEQVDAGPFGKVVREIRRQMRRQARFEARRLDHLLHPLGADRALERREQVGQHRRVAERTVALAALEAPALDQRVEVVPVVLGEERARQANRAQHRRRELLAHATELVAHEPVVEAGVVRDEQAPLEPARGPPTRRSSNVGASATISLVMPVKLSMDGGMRWHGIDEAAPLLDDRAVVEQHDADLGDPVLRGRAAGRLEVDARDRPAQHGRAERDRPGAADAAGAVKASPSPSSVMIGP